MRAYLGLLAGAAFLGTSVAPSMGAATLLYQWNFDNNGGTGTSVTPSVTPNGVATDGGVLTMAQAGGTTTLTPTNLYSASGAGVTGAAGDYAFDNSASVSGNPTPGGITYSSGVAAANNANTLNALPTIGVGNAITEYSMTMWVKPTAAELSVQSRLLQISTIAATSYDEAATGLWVGLNAGHVQFGGSSASNNFIETASLVANTWNFVSVEVDLGSSNAYFDADMRTALGANANTSDSAVLYQGDSASGVYGPTGQAGFANGTVTFASQGDYAQMLNRGTNDQRAFQGLGDDFRIYSGLLTSAQLQTLSAEAPTAVPEPVSLTVFAAGLAGMMARRRSR